eukprot:symbB.v1.2.036132.t1/scaffold5032.1/size31635/1
MAEASRDLAQGIIEVSSRRLTTFIAPCLFIRCMQVMVSESVCAKERMEAREVEEAYQKFEESEEHIKELLDRGTISMDEARRLRTRGKMHQQEEQDNKPKISSAVLAGADHKTNEQIIEEALKPKKGWWLTESLRKALRLDKLQNRIQIAKHKRSLPEFEHRQLCILCEINVSFHPQHGQDRHELRVVHLLPSCMQWPPDRYPDLCQRNRK